MLEPFVGDLSWLEALEFELVNSKLPKCISIRSAELLDSFFSSVLRWVELVFGRKRARLNLSTIVRHGLWARDGGSWDI